MQEGCSLALQTPVERDPGRNARPRADDLVSDRRPQSDPNRGHFGGEATHIMFDDDVTFRDWGDTAGYCLFSSWAK